MTMLLIVIGFQIVVNCINCLSKKGRVIDSLKNDASTSEGQAW